jgi:hypothetical protein
VVVVPPSSRDGRQRARGGGGGGRAPCAAATAATAVLLRPPESSGHPDGAPVDGHRVVPAAQPGTRRRIGSRNKWCADVIGARSLFTLAALFRDDDAAIE